VRRRGSQCGAPTRASVRGRTIAHGFNVEFHPRPRTPGDRPARGAASVADLVDDDGFLALCAEVSVNGRPVGEDLVSNMGWPFAELVAYASRNSRIVPGDVHGSGTVGNGGCLAELWGRGVDIPALRPGDEVRMRVERLGEIVNTVGAMVDAPPVAHARQRSRLRVR
jgi:hypothetical protein